MRTALTSNWIQNVAQAARLCGTWEQITGEPPVLRNEQLLLLCFRDAQFLQFRGDVYTVSLGLDHLVDR